MSVIFRGRSAAAWAAALPLLAIALGGPVAEAATPGSPAATELDEVVVVGKRTGPGMWKVTHGDHVLWLLGTPELLPARMEWDSTAVEAVMAQSQARIGGPHVSVKGGPITLFRLYRQWRGMQQTDEHAPLHATLPPAVYQRYEALRQRFAPRETGWEKLRPMLAADRLFDAAIERSGLKRARGVDAIVDKLAERHKVRRERAEMQIDEPEQLLRELAATPEASELRCMESTLTRLETDLDASRKRATAWARGDLNEIRALVYPDNRRDCQEAVAVTPRMQALLTRSQQLWLQAVDAALASNASTVATRPIQELLRPEGILQTLEQRGYHVTSP